jgi:hypothetical protein
VKEKFIAKVPEHLILQPTDTTSRSLWSGRYNVAIWVRLHQIRPGNINLVLKYMDREGVTRRVVVDQASAEFTSSVLLSGEVMIPAVGKVIDMGVYLETSENCPAVTVDELYLQSSDHKAKQSGKLIAAA